MKRLVFLFASILLLEACHKEYMLLPTILISEPTEITEYSASISGEIKSNGGSLLISYGLYYGSAPNPESTGTEMIVNVSDTVPGLGPFEFTLIDLIPNTTYYLKAFATNGMGTVYGEEHVFVTKDGPLSKKIQSIVVDSENNIWCGTTGGLSMFDGSNWTNYTTSQGLINKNIHVLLFDKPGALWIGTEGGLSRFDGSDWSNYTQSDGLARNDVRSIVQHPDNNNLLIGTVGNGLSGYNESSFTAYFIFPTLSMGTLGHIHTLCYDRDENVWVGSCLTGLSMCDGEKWFHHINKLNSNVIASLCASDGSLWFGTRSGVYKYADSMWTIYAESDGLIYKDITSLIEDKDKRIWVGATEGLFYFSEGVFTQADKGLPDKHVNALALDLDGNIWVGTDDGISKIDYSEKF